MIKKSLLLIFLLPVLFACNRTSKVVLEALKPNIIPAPASMCPSGGWLIDGNLICNGISLGVSVVNSLNCINGGSTIEFFNDYNLNGIKDSLEPVVSVSEVCNGLNANLIIGTATITQCPNGGITVNGQPVCNGLDGLTNSNVVATKLCPADTNPMAEYGVFVGGHLYAVLYDNRTAHPHNIGLVRLVPGIYLTTTTSVSRQFTYTNNGTVAKLVCDGVEFVYTITNP